MAGGRWRGEARVDGAPLPAGPSGWWGRCCAPPAGDGMRGDATCMICRDGLPYGAYGYGAGEAP